MDFNMITDRLATGAAITSGADVDALIAAQINFVIDCRDDFDDASLLAVHPSIAYMWNGTPDDGSTKPPAWFAKSLVFALAALAQPSNKVYCHCAAGINRGPSTAFAIMLAVGFTPALAETTIRTARPQVGLAYKQDAIDAIGLLGY